MRYKEAKVKIQIHLNPPKHPNASYGRKQMIGYPRVDSDLFMFAASLRRSPSAPELFCLVT